MFSPKKLLCLALPVAVYCAVWLVACSITPVMRPSLATSLHFAYRKIARTV